MLESISRGFLKKDFYSHAQENKIPIEFLTSLTDTELLKLAAVLLYVLLRSRKRILESKDGRLPKSEKEIQLVCNNDPYSPRRSRK